MWIISNSLLESWNGAPDTAALEWDSKELSEICERSLTRRSSFIAAKSWRAVWKRGKSTLPRFGLILNPSHANAFEEWWISSLPVTPASPSAQPAKDKAKKTKKDATCGPSSKGQLVMFDLTGSSARTSQATLPSALKTSATTWTNWVTKLRRDCSRREKSACRTRDNDSSSWPTIRAQEPGWTSDGYGDNLVKRMTRSTESAWPTPQVSDENGAADPNREDHRVQLRDVETGLGSTSPPPDPDQSNTGGNPPECWPTITQQCDMETNGPKGNQGTYLLGAVKESWPTPRAQENDEPPEKWEKRRKEKEEQGINLHLPLSVKAKQEQGSAWPTPRETASRDAQEDRGKGNLGEVIQHGTGMKLSPRWVEALMGLPIGWTDPTCSRPISPWEAVYTAASMNSEPSETE